MTDKNTEAKAPHGREASALDALVMHLARSLTKDLFDVGADRENDRPHRIQFMGGEYPGNEKPMGGFCEKALTKYFAKQLKTYLSA